MHRSTVIYIAIYHNDIDAIRLLLKHPYSVPYKLLIANRYTSMIGRLINRMKHQIDYMIPYLHYAATCGSYMTVDMLLDVGLSINAKCPSNTTALYHANDINMACYLINRGAEINTSTYYGTTPLHIHAKKSNIEIVSLLIALGADIDAKEYYGTKPIDHMYSNGHLLHWPCSDRSLLHDAAANGSHIIVRCLITNGIDVNLLDQFGRTALHYACQSGHLLTVTSLILKGANINIADHHDRTPITEAISSLFFYIVKTDLNAVKITDYFLICKMLMNAGATISDVDQVYIRSIRARTSCYLTA